MKKPGKRTRITELTPEVLNQLDQETLVGLIMKLFEQNKQLSERLQAFMHEKYGRKTEKHEDPNQLRILPVDTPTPKDQASDSEAEAETEKKSQPPKKPGHSRNPMPSHLKRRTLERQPTDNERICKCGTHRVKVNSVVRNTRFECIPVTIYNEEIVDSVWECPACQDAIIVESDAVEPIVNGTAGPRLLVKIAEDRWLNHSPVHRQQQIFARLGVDVARSTMCGWMGALASTYRSVYDCMKAELLESKIIATDDTPVKVQDRRNGGGD